MYFISLNILCLNEKSKYVSGPKTFTCPLLLENEENKVIALKNAIQEGLNSPRVENFDFDKNLKN
jgi:hypothetical protein